MEGYCLECQEYHSYSAIEEEEVCIEAESDQ